MFGSDRNIILEHKFKKKHTIFHTIKHLCRRLLTQTAVAEVLSEADVAQLAGCDLAHLQSHGRAVAHRLHAHTHRLHPQYQHRHLEDRSAQKRSGKLWLASKPFLTACRFLTQVLCTHFEARISGHYYTVTVNIIHRERCNPQQ